MIRTYILTVFTVSFCLIATSQDISFCYELGKINGLVETSHYSPKPLNDSLSKGVFSLFLKSIDENQTFFTQEDVNTFKSDEYLIDDYIKSKDCDFIEKYSTTLQERINKSKRILEDLKKQKLDYTGKDSLLYSKDDDVEYFKNDTKVLKYWNKKVRYKLLRKLVENDSVLDNIKNNFKALEADIKDKIIQNEICLLDELLQTKGSVPNMVESAFLDAFLKYQDPNSSYFLASEKNIFYQSLSNSKLSFGITTSKKKNGDIVISFITPGSAAFKNGGLDVEDVILEIQNKNKTLETYCTSNETIRNFIDDVSSNVMTFKIKKQDGQIKSIKLRKTEIEVEENSITGYVLTGDEAIGYINIPSFYTDTESLNGLGVANDVAKQLYKLQKENIQGLIIDLRFNGGGSMKEAADLSGMFIDRGPVAISKYRNEDLYTIRDPNRGSLFTKPIVILINQFSASASEFFAGALQDYNRAIVVGTATHGKATSQVVLPVENSQNSNYIKITTGKFFRVTGHSHQQTGVMPDIVIKDIYHNYESQEFFKAFSLSNETVQVTLKHRPKLKKDLTSILENSRARITNNSIFKSIESFNAIFINDYVNKEGIFPLTLDYIFNDNKRYNDAWKTYNDSIENNTTLIDIKNTSSTTAILEYNEDSKNLNQQLLKELKTDPHIQEAYFIINDIINL
ncbi:MAG: carboxy terminal-processing peptidase [Winogradskyella sp.]